MIPHQLQDEKFRFVLIKPHTKVPFEFNWQEKSNYRFNHKTILRHNGNLGAVCGYGGLIVLDIDDIETIDEFDRMFDTFSVTTGSGKRHYYFICDEKFNKNYYVLGSVGELRCSKSQVVIPDSIHPNGCKYEVFNNSKIQKITKKRLRLLLGGLLEKGERITDNSRSGQDWKDCCEMITAGYNFDETDKELMLIGSSRWRIESMNYKINTFCNALKSLKKTRDCLINGSS